MSSYPVTPSDSGVTQSAAEVNQLAARVAALESRLPANSWLFGDSFLKRVFAVWGHYFVAQLIIGLVIGLLFFVCTLAFGGLIAGLSNR